MRADLLSMEEELMLLLLLTITYLCDYGAICSREDGRHNTVIVVISLVRGHESWIQRILSDLKWPGMTRRKVELCVWDVICDVLIPLVTGVYEKPSPAMKWLSSLTFHFPKLSSPILFDSLLFSMVQENPKGLNYYFSPHRLSTVIPSTLQNDENVTEGAGLIAILAQPNLSKLE